MNNADACFFAEDSFKSTILSIFRINSATNETTKVEQAGTIDYDSGKISINLFTPLGWIDNNEQISFYAKPKINDVESARNIIIVIDDADINVIVEDKK